MRSTGNTISNQIYNPSNKPPPVTSFSGGDTSEELQLERYIRDKYERKTLIKSRKLPPLPSPTFQGNPEKVNAILGPPKRSPSFESGSSLTFKPGLRVSGDSFERARSPASTNSSIELPLPKPPRPTTEVWGSLAIPFLPTNPFVEKIQPLPNPSPTPAVPLKGDVLYTQSQNGLNVSLNPFQDPSAFAPQPQPQPQPVPPVPILSPPPQNPAEQGLQSGQPSSALLRSESIPSQGSQPLWNPGISSATSQQSVLTFQSTLSSPLAQRGSSFPQDPGRAPIPPNNPFLSNPQPSQNSSPMTPSNPFFAPQQLSLTPTFASQPLYQTQSSVQRPFLPSPPQPQYPSQPEPFLSAPTYPQPRLDNKTILNLFNSPPASNPSFVPSPQNNPAWNHGMQY